MTCSRLSCDGDGGGEERTDGFDTLLCPSGSLERTGSLFDALVGMFLDFIGVVFMPSGTTMSGHSTNLRKCPRTPGLGSIGGTRSGVALGYRRIG